MLKYNQNRERHEIRAGGRSSGAAAEHMNSQYKTKMKEEA